MTSRPRLVAALGLGLVAARGLVVALGLVLAACPARREEGSGAQTPPSQPTDEAKPPTTSDPPAAATDEAAEADESAHHVVFSDRTSQTYLLLLPGSPAAPTREALAELVKKKLASAEDEPEVELLLDLVATEPRPLQTDPELGVAERNEIRHADLLGLHVALLPIAPPGEDPLVSPATLQDPIATRELSEADRASLPARRHVLVLRAHYRNRYGLRGLRLLQTLVRIVATDRKALIHDPDTGETMDVTTFTRRRLQSTLGNVADQVVVVPFPDPRHGKGFVRMSTRGMRRFGSVDLELDGLPRDAAVLEAASQLLQGLAYRMARAGEYDQEGYAVEADEEIGPLRAGGPLRRLPRARAPAPGRASSRAARPDRARGRARGRAAPAERVAGLRSPRVGPQGDRRSAGRTVKSCKVYR
jgi:hypothetical protein